MREGDRALFHFSPAPVSRSKVVWQWHDVVWAIVVVVVVFLVIRHFFTHS